MFLIIADLQSHSLGGHFGLWLNRTLAEALRYFEQVAVYVADEMSLPDLCMLPPPERRRLQTFIIPEIYQQRKLCGDILGVISRHHASLMTDAPEAPVFLMWAQQFIERDLIFPPIRSWLPWKKPLSFDSPWATMTSVSSVSHDRSTAPEMEFRIHEMIGVQKNCIEILLWDEYAVRNLGGKYAYLPDFEPCEADPDWKLPESDPITLGSVGQLWGGRSVNLLAEIMESETGFRGYLGGVLKPDSYTERAGRVIKDTERITMDEGFVESDEELNQRLRRVDAFVIDSRTYKCPSGLAIRAMAMGRPIVTVDSPSWIANLIKEQGVGVFWDRDNSSLESKLRDWSNSSGAQRSMAAAQKLSDRQGMENAFARVFQRLKEASAE
jgi:glycosyltransferase involved in cell wall biosynthesis